MGRRNARRPPWRAWLGASLLATGVAGAQPVAIPRGHEEEIAVMLGRGEALPGGCRWQGARVEPYAVRARYACAGGEAVGLTLSLPGRGGAGSVPAGAFDVSVDDGSHAALRDAVAARVRGGARGPMVVAVGERPAVRRLGPFELGRAAGGDDLTRPPWLDLPLGLLVLALLAAALRPRSPRRDLAAAAVAALALLALARVGGDVPVHSDVLRDLLFARDCVEARRCHALGPESSLTVIRHGTLWLRLPEWALRLGGDERALRGVVELCHALAVAVLALALRRHGAPREAPLVALAGGVGALWVAGHPLLWHPSVVPLFASLYAALLLDALREPSPRRWALAGASLGLLFDAHPSTFALAPCLALAGCARAERPRRDVPLALLVAAGALALPSPLLALARVAEAWGDPRAAALLVATALAAFAGLALRPRVAHRDPRSVGALALALHAASLALLAVAARRAEARYLAAAVPFAAGALALRTSSHPAAVAGLVALTALLVMARARVPAGGARWSIAEARAVLRSPPLRGRSWADLAARLQVVDGEGFRAVAGIVAPRGRASDAPGAEALLVVRIPRSALPERRPAAWSVVDVGRGDVAVVRPLRSFLPLGRSRACVGVACADVDLGAPAGGATPFGPRAFAALPALVELARDAPAGERLRLTLAVSVPGGGPDHRLAPAPGEPWRVDGVHGDVRATTQGAGAVVLAGDRAASGALEVSMPLGGGVLAAPTLLETSADEGALDALLRGR